MKLQHWMVVAIVLAVASLLGIAFMFVAGGGTTSQYGDVMGVLGAVVGGATTGILALAKRAHSLGARERKALMHVSAGDRFSLDGDDEGARREYERALEVEPGNVAVQRKLAHILCRAVLERVYSSPQVDLASPDPFGVAKEETAAALRQLYRFQGRSPQLLKDVGLLLDEVRVLRAAGQTEGAIRLIEKRGAIAGGDPNVQAELGLLYACEPDAAPSPTRAVELLEDAVAKAEDEPRLHFYLAKVLAEDERHGLALRHARRAFELPATNDPDAQRVAFDGITLAFSLYDRHRDGEGEPLAGIDLPLEERLATLQALIARSPTRRSSNPVGHPRFLLARLLEAAGRGGEAEPILDQLLKDESHPDRRRPWVTLLVRLLQRSGSDPERLASLTAELQDA